VLDCVTAMLISSLVAYLLNCGCPRPPRPGPGRLRDACRWSWKVVISDYLGAVEPPDSPSSGDASP